MLKLLAIVLLPFYATAYGIAKLFRMDGHEDMPTIAEFIGIDRKECEEV